MARWHASRCVPTRWPPSASPSRWASCSPSCSCAKRTLRSKDKAGHCPALFVGGGVAQRPLPTRERPSGDRSDLSFVQVALVLVARDGGGAGVGTVDPAEGDAVVTDLDVDRAVRDGQQHAVAGTEAHLASDQGLLGHGVLLWSVRSRDFSQPSGRWLSANSAMG